jgi:hypothetical protein
VAEYHGEHEPVGDGELIKGNVFCFHFSFYSGNAPVSRTGKAPSMYKTLF